MPRNADVAAERPVDRRADFRARCLALARTRGDGGEAAVAALFRAGPAAVAEAGLDLVGGTRDPVALDAAAAGPATPDSTTLGPATSDPAASAPATLRPGTPDPAARHPAGPAPMLVVPGLLGDAVSGLVAPFGHAREALSAAGRQVDVAWVGGRSGCTRNAARLRSVVLERAAAHGAPIDLVGYSKGCTDALHMLGDWPDTHAALRSLTSLGGVVLGTPLADRTPGFTARLLGLLPLPDIGLGFGQGDGQAIADLVPARRRRWLAEHPLPDTVRRLSIVASASTTRVSRALRPSWRTLSRHDPANDSQVIARDTLLPGGELLAIVDADHWALALPIAERSPWLARLLVNRNDFPRAVLLEALMDHLAETTAPER